MSPQNASTDESTGLRSYQWAPADGSAPVDVLSVTSIRRLCGISINLSSWMTANLVNSATGTRQVEKIGPRGGVKKSYVPDGPFPGEFAKRLLETEGDEAKLALLRRWLRESSEHPRDIAAMRGSIVHDAIEKGNLSPSTEKIIALFEAEGRERKRGGPITVTDDDITFVKRTLDQYRHFADTEPGQVLATEVQVWNLELGYAGSLDVMREVEYRGEMVTAVIDYKTGTDTYTDNVAQVHGYLGAEFVGKDGVVDATATKLLQDCTHGGILHLRPEGWSLHLFPFLPEVMQAFVGSVMLARLLADHERPDHLFAETRSGKVDE